MNLQMFYSLMRLFNGVFTIDMANIGQQSLSKGIIKLLIKLQNPEEPILEIYFSDYNLRLLL